MSCLIYHVDLESQRRRQVDVLGAHTRMSKWLRANGQQEYVYEIWKHNGLHSRWCWKENKQRWGRMATPAKKDR